MGALLGEKAIPEHWLADLELRPVIQRMADELADRYGPRRAETGPPFRSGGYSR